MKYKDFCKKMYEIYNNPKNNYYLCARNNQIFISYHYGT